MSHIELLSSDTINRIAAGEVIERPASVVKELLENSVDAGAGAVTVEARDGGLSFIRVTDNGSGIPKDEVSLAFERHATSKIRSELDLISVSSLGFRGEALSSIASVAKVEMITRRHDDLMGTRYVIEGGKQSSIEDIGSPEGTTIIMRDLFFNTPARRKFMKTAVTEGSYISSVVETLALSHPEVSFRLLMNGRSVLHTSGNGRVRDIIYLIYGREAADELFEVSDENRDRSSDEDTVLRVSGYAAKPVFSRGNRSCEIFFVNGRYIKSPLLIKALENAYSGFLMQHRYPFAVLYLDIDPALIDVNVHPAKREIRFRQEDMIYHSVYDAVRKALERQELIPKAGFDRSGLNRRRPTFERPAEKPPEPFERVRRESGNELSTIERLQQSFREETDGSVKDDRPSCFETKVDADGAYLGKKVEHGAGIGAYVEEAEQDGDAGADKASGAETEYAVADKASGAETEYTVADKASGAETEYIVAGKASGAETEYAGADKVSEAGTEYAGGDGSYDVKVNQGDSADYMAFVTEKDHSFVTEEDYPADNRAQNGITAYDRANQAKNMLRESPGDSVSPDYAQLSFGERLFTEETRKEYVLLGQLFGTYWLIQYRDKFMMIDQHAAHEKVLFEELMASFARQTINSQQLLQPIILTLNDREIQAVERLTPQLSALGYDIRPFGGKEYAVYGIPYNLYSIAEEELLREMIDSLTEEEAAETGDLLYERIATMSCKAAVKGNTAMSRQEADALIDRLLKLEHPYTCPHGRPTMIVMSKNEIEKKFKRIVSA